MHCGIKKEKIDALWDSFCPFCNPTMSEVCDILLFAISLIYMTLTLCSSHPQTVIVLASNGSLIKMLAKYRDLVWCHHNSRYDMYTSTLPHRIFYLIQLNWVQHRSSVTCSFILHTARYLPALVFIPKPHAVQALILAMHKMHREHVWSSGTEQDS